MKSDNQSVALAALYGASSATPSADAKAITRAQHAAALGAAILSLPATADDLKRAAWCLDAALKAARTLALRAGASAGELP